MWTFALFGAKIIGFFEINGVSARTRGEGVEPVRTRGGGQFFVNYVRATFMDGPLSTRTELRYAALTLLNIDKGFYSQKV